MSASAPPSPGLEIALLGLLRTHPRHAYELHQLLTEGSEPLGIIWRLKQSNLYALLAKLEEAGYVRRERDATDRRRVVIHLIVQPVLRDVVTVFAPMMAEWKKIADGYTDEELEFILRFQAQTEQVLRGTITRLRGLDGAAPRPGPQAPAI